MNGSCVEREPELVSAIGQNRNAIAELRGLLGEMHGRIDPTNPEFKAAKEISSPPAPPQDLIRVRIRDINELTDLIRECINTASAIYSITREI